MSKTIRTILHVSDLHIGDMDRLNGNSECDAQTLEWWRISRVFDGYLGHTYVALQRLADLISDLREEGLVDLVVTGDLTTIGKSSQQQMALEYIRGDISLRDELIGLLEPAAIVVPGNHDHWPGRVCDATRLLWCMCGATGIHVAHEFSNLPSIVRIPLTSDCNLVVASVNSDAGVGASSINRILARGSFVTECEALAETLGWSAADELRILLIHHSYVQRGVALSMDSQSKEALERLVATCGVRLILTGHAHEFRISDINPQFRELRCGTTTSRDHFPDKWLKSCKGRYRQLPKNSALVHIITEDNGRVFWTTQVWTRTSRAAAFARAHEYEPLKVWP